MPRNGTAGSGPNQRFRRRHRLDLASELAFARDAGTTEAGRSSRRQGIELTNDYSPWRQQLRLSIDVFNALNAGVSGIDYFCVSRLRGEPESGIADVHLHPTLPRTVRLTLTASF